MTFKRKKMRMLQPCIDKTTFEYTRTVFFTLQRSKNQKKNQNHIVNEYHCQPNTVLIGYPSFSATAFRRGTNCLNAFRISVVLPAHSLHTSSFTEFQKWQSKGLQSGEQGGQSDDLTNRLLSFVVKISLKQPMPLRFSTKSHISIFKTNGDKTNVFSILKFGSAAKNMTNICPNNRRHP